MKSYKVSAIYDYNSTFPVKVGNLTFNNYNYYANTNEENDKSLVISFTNCGKDFVIMGDAPSYIEKEIIRHEENIKCDILKVGHHGSNTSTCEDWVKYLSPETAIVSCGKNNRFGHPNKEVVSVLNKYKIKIRRTDMEGTIVYKQLFVE
jgi:competence protein ComEC